MRLVNAFPELVQAVDKNGNCALHCACAAGQGEVAEALLRRDPRLAGKYNVAGLTPLHTAAINYKYPVVRAFIMWAPMSSFQCLTKDGETVFHLAAKHGHREALILLRPLCNTLNLLACHDRHGNTVLHVAVSEGHYMVTSAW